MRVASLNAGMMIDRYNFYSIAKMFKIRHCEEGFSPTKQSPSAWRQCSQLTTRGLLRCRYATQFKWIAMTCGVIQLAGARPNSFLQTIIEPIAPAPRCYLASSQDPPSASNASRRSLDNHIDIPANLPSPVRSSSAIHYTS